MNLLQNLFGFERRETAGEIIFFRVFEAFVALATVKLAWDWGLYIPRISDVVLPLGLAHYLDVSFMFGSQLPSVNASLITGLTALSFLRITRYGYAGAFLLLLVQYAARYTLGEIPHSANMLGMTFLALALALLVFERPLRQRRFALGSTYFFVGLGYTLSAFCKLVATGLTWPDGRHLWLWIHEKSVDVFAKTGELSMNGLQELALESYWVATAFLTIGLLTELFAFLMWWRRFRGPVCLAVIGLHLGIHLVMRILFTLSLVELLLLAFPWAAWIDRVLPAAATRRALRRYRFGYAWARDVS